MGKKNSNEEKLIGREMMLGDLVQKYPNAAMLMAKRGMHCVGCGMAAWETIEQGCRAHGMDDKQIEDLLKEMNRIARENKEEK